MPDDASPKRPTLRLARGRPQNHGASRLRRVALASSQACQWFPATTRCAASSKHHVHSSAVFGRFRVAFGLFGAGLGSLLFPTSSPAKSPTPAPKPPYNPTPSKPTKNLFPPPLLNPEP